MHRWPVKPVKPVKDICELIVDCVNKTAPIVDYETPYKMIRTTNIKQGRVNMLECRQVNLETYEKWTRRAKILGGDVLLTREAPLGEVGFIHSDSTYFLGQRIMQYRANREIVEPRYLYYAFRSKYVQDQIHAHSGTGSVVDHIRVPDCEKFLIPIPPREIQNKISISIGAIDDKIDLNNQINETLESMAKAIFKEWFIDFGPVKAKAEGKKPYGMDDETASLFPDTFEDSELGQIPKGWRVSSVDDVCVFQNGYAFKSNLMTTDPKDAKRIFKMGNITKGGGFNADGSDDYYPNTKSHGLDRYLAQKGDLLMCMTDMKNNVALLGNTALMPVSNEYLVNQRVGLLRTKNENVVNYPFLFLLTNESAFLEELRSRANSGVQVNLSTEEIKKSKFVLPIDTVHKAFDKIALPFFEQIELNRKESESLKTTRDLLLPKLISGEITLEKI